MCKRGGTSNCCSAFAIFGYSTGHVCRLNSTLIRMNRTSSFDRPAVREEVYKRASEIKSAQYLPKAFLFTAMALCGAKCMRFLGPNVYPEAPDGGWGWVVAVAFFMVEVFTYGTIKSFGIFLQDLMKEFGESNSRVSWIVSICVFVMTFTGE